MDLNAKKFCIVEHYPNLRGSLSSLNFPNHARGVTTVLSCSLLSEPQFLPAPFECISQRFGGRSPLLG